MAYEVRVVAQDGTSYGTVDDAVVSALSWELNGAGSATIVLPTTDADAALMVPGRDVQIYLTGITDPIWWGTIIRPQAGLDSTSWQCKQLLWHFGRRYMGRADRVNQLTNGDFEAGETDWSFVGGVTHSIDTVVFLEGLQSLELQGMAADHAGYATQTWTHPAGGYPTGDYLTAAVWVYIPSASYVGGAANDLGLVAVHRDAGGNVLAGDFALIDDDTEKDEWIPLEVGVHNVLEGHTVEVKLIPPHGIAYFDLATLTFMESLSFGYPPPAVDVTDIIHGIVDYAQNRIFDHGKSDLDIGTAGTAIGATRQIAYQFAEHRNILDAILEYVRQGLCDISIETTATTRTFTVWPGQKGSLYGTTLQLDVNLADFTYSQDLEQGASTIVLLGPGDGPDRPEGGATDTSYAAGVFTAEIVEQAPDPTTVGQLDSRAAERLATAAHPQILEVTTLPGAGVIGNLSEGDTVAVVISRGWVAINDTYRVARIEANLETDQATIALNALP